MTIAFRTLLGAAGRSVAPAPSHIVQDTFTDSDGTSITSHTTDTSQSWVADAYALGSVATGDIQSNQLRMTSDNGMLTVDSGVSDVDLSVDWTLDGTSGHRNGLVFRHAHNESFWMVRFRQPNGDIALFEWGASLVQRDTAAKTWSLSTTYNIRVVANGTSITAYVDGVEMLSYASSLHQSQTGVGLIRFTGLDATRFDNFEVVSP